VGLNSAGVCLSLERVMFCQVQDSATEPITCPEESFRVRVFERDRKALTLRRPWPSRGRRAIKKILTLC
jgi:hypothetical protein